MAKKGTSIRLPEVAKKILAAEVAARKKILGKDAKKITETDVIIDALYALASKKPELRDIMIEEAKKNPLLSHLPEVFLAKDKNKT